MRIKQIHYIFIHIHHDNDFENPTIRGEYKLIYNEGTNLATFYFYI